MFQIPHHIFPQQRKFILGLAALVILGILALQSVQADSIYTADPYLT